MINFAMGFVACLVIIQFEPRVALAGKWIVDRVKRLFRGDAPQ